jgi:hypothetical protein
VWRALEEHPIEEKKEEEKGKTFLLDLVQQPTRHSRSPHKNQSAGYPTPL